MVKLSTRCLIARVGVATPAAQFGLNARTDRVSDAVFYWTLGIFCPKFGSPKLFFK